MERKKKILKRAFWLFCLLQVFFIFKRVHNYPFMIFDMYSRPERAAPLSNHFVIIMDGDTLNTTKLPIYTEGRLLNNLNIYHYLLENQYDYWNPSLTNRRNFFGHGKFAGRFDRLLRNSSQIDNTYPAWLHEQLIKWTGESYGHLVVNRVEFDRQAKKIISSHPIIDYQND